jgi:ParB family chromosome partitioning protein
MPEFMSEPSPETITEVEHPKDLRRRALGRGIESLLPGRPAILPTVAAQATREPIDATGRPREIPVDQIDRNPYQTRTRFDERQLAELTASVAATGVVQPILVRSLPSGRFQLIAGERRWLASKQAGKATIPAVIRQVSDEQAMEITIVENLQRTDLNPMEQARAFDRLAREFKMTQEQIATRTGKDRTSVNNFLRLLRLPTEIQQLVEGGELSFGHARTLSSLQSPEDILKAAQKVIALSMSVRQTETYVHGLLHPEDKPQKQKWEEVIDPNVRDAQERIQRALGLRVKIEDKDGRGRVIIEYSRLEDFDALLASLVTE